MHDIGGFADGEPAGVLLETVSTPTATVVVVSVTGEIDMLSETQLMQGLREALDQPDASAVVIDLSGVTFFSSSGIAALATAHTSAADKNQLLHVVIPPDSPTYRPLQLTGLTELLTIHPTRTAAMANHHAAPVDLGANDPTTGDDDDPHDSGQQLITAG